MDRRDFLKTGGAAAVAAGTVASPAQAEQPKAPAILSGARQLIMTSSWGGDLPGSGAERLAWRIETATGGRFRIEIANGSADADLTYGPGDRQARLHPAFAFFAGLPFAQGLDAAAHQTWLAIGGGQMLWDELAAQFGFKPLVAGHTGPSAGVWASARLETKSDLSDARVHVGGLAADAMRALGATVVELSPQELKAALAVGRIQAAEWLGPLAAAAADLQPLAERLYLPGFTRGGVVLSLAVGNSLWNGMSATDRTIFEACAAQEYQLSLTDAHAHAILAEQIGTRAKWPVKHTLSGELADAFEEAANGVVSRVAAADPDARRIHDSLRAFREISGEPRTA